MPATLTSSWQIHPHIAQEIACRLTFSMRLPAVLLLAIAIIVYAKSRHAPLQVGEGSIGETPEALIMLNNTIK